MDWLWGLLFAGAALLLGMFLEAKKAGKTESRGEAAGAEEVPQTVGAVKGHYQAKYLLTKNEWYEYKKLKEYAAAYQLQVCPRSGCWTLWSPGRATITCPTWGRSRVSMLIF